ncbi:MAG TPA: hypothetical protein VLE93_00830 [Candidatus Saccharimonadales bacterium]|nr:hypothetical protein [Candidatus Saccharimonadales bacterium]
MWKRVFVGLLAAALIWPVLTTRAASPLGSAINYLQTNYSGQGAGNRDWAAIGLGENGISTDPSAPDASSLLSLERNALARAAQGATDQNEISQIEAAYQNDQFGSPSLINDDIFGVLAVAGADPNWLAGRQGVFTTIAASQRTDGSFGFSTGGSGDGDITSAAIWALRLATNQPTSTLNDAATFLTYCHNADGGFAVLPGQVSNVATAAWAMIAQNALGQDPSAVRNYLFGQEQNGGFWLQSSAANYLNTAYAVMALSGQKLPFKKPPAVNQPPATNGANQIPGSTRAPAGNQPAAQNKPVTQNSAGPNQKNSGSATATPLIANQPIKPKKKVTRRVVKTTTITTYQTLTCSASASASAGDGYATASASASCN